MAIQVNTRVPEKDWERIIEAFPGISNAERVSVLIQHELTSLAARKDLATAIRAVESLLAPAVQGLREQNLRGRGSTAAEMLATTVTEMAALLLSHVESLKAAPERAVPELEGLLMQRWARATIQLLREAALEPTAIRNAAAVEPEVRRVFDQVALLTAARAATAPGSAPAADR
jgi:hypothetical protein